MQFNFIMPAQIDVSLAAIVAFGAAGLGWWLANRKRADDRLDSKRKSADEFLAKINECLFDAKQAGNQGAHCVCHKSYAKFRLTVSGAEATALEKCWSEYIVANHGGNRCIECLECLHELVHKYTETVGARSVVGCSVCGSPRVKRFTP